MRFVYVIAQLKRDLAATDNVLIDLDDMVAAIRDSNRVGSSVRAMVSMISAIEKQVMTHEAHLNAKLKRYECRRDFRPLVSWL